MSARYKSLPAKGLYLGQASTGGYNEYMVRAGDLVRYCEYLADGLCVYRNARALDLVTHGHNGEEFRAPTGRGKQTKRAPMLRVFAFNGLLDFGYERWVKVEDVAECVRVSPERARFVAWLVAGPLPKTDTLLAASSYGVVSSTYFGQVANEAGALGEDWRARNAAFHSDRKVGGK